MTEEENKKYEEKRAVLEAMTDDQKMEKLDVLLEEVFMMANSYAGNRGPVGVASMLHESANHIMKAQKILTGEAKPGIPVEFMLRSMGLGMGTSMIDLQIKQEMDEDGNNVE
jgi:hypothetical protein